jgi:uncharacterized RDD family membrane protein YckC
MESTQPDPVSTENVLDEVQYTLTQANGWRRFFNWVIDRAAIYIVWRYLLFRVNVAILTEIYRYSESRTVLYIFAYLMYVAFFILVQSSLETLMNGKTLGKLITGTRAVNQDGTPVTGRTAFLRGLSRLVPFEPFSALGAPCFPWHDRWTNTYVINERESSLPA